MPCTGTDMSVQCRRGRCPGGLQIRHASFDKPSTHAQTPWRGVRGLSQDAAISGSWQGNRRFWSGVAILPIVRQATSEILRLQWSRWIRRQVRCAGLEVNSGGAKYPGKLHPTLPDSHGFPAAAFGTDPFQGCHTHQQPCSRCPNTNAVDELHMAGSAFACTCMA